MLRQTFAFVETENDAKEMCKSIQKQQNSYRKQFHKPHYTPWTSSDGKEHCFVVWYVPLWT